MVEVASSRDETDLLQQVGDSDFVVESTVAPILTYDRCLPCADFQNSRPCILFTAYKLLACGVQEAFYVQETCYVQAALIIHRPRPWPI